MFALHLPINVRCIRLKVEFTDINWRSPVLISGQWSLALWRCISFNPRHSSKSTHFRLLNCSFLTLRGRIGHPFLERDRNKKPIWPIYRSYRHYRTTLLTPKKSITDAPYVLWTLIFLRLFHRWEIVVDGEFETCARRTIKRTASGSQRRMMYFLGLLHEKMFAGEMR